MPRQKSFVTAIRELVRKELSQQIGNLLGSIGGGGTTKRRRRRRRGRGPGPPPPPQTKRPRGPPPPAALGPGPRRGVGGGGGRRPPPPGARARGEPAVRDGAARERGRRRSAYEAPHGSVAPGPVSNGAESKRRRCPRSRARQSRVTLLDRDATRAGRGGRAARAGASGRSP